MKDIQELSIATIRSLCIDMINKAVSSDETTSKVWGPGSGHFDRLSNGIIEDLGNVIVKPE